MTTAQTITLVVAILGVLHGPGTQALLIRLFKRPPKT